MPAPHCHNGSCRYVRAGPRYHTKFVTRCIRLKEPPTLDSVILCLYHEPFVSRILYLLLWCKAKWHRFPIDEKSLPFFSDWHDKNSENKRWILCAIQIEIRNLENFALIFSHRNEVHLWVLVSTEEFLYKTWKWQLWKCRGKKTLLNHEVGTIVSLYYFLFTLTSLQDLYTICFQIIS